MASLFFSGCASDPYSWEKDYYRGIIIGKCKIYRPTDKQCNLYANQVLYVSSEDGWLSHNLNQINNSCAKKYTEDEAQKQLCITQSRKFFWDKFIEGIFEKRN